MAFTNSWVETDPDGNVIFVSQLDDSDRLIKGAVRERLEGDPANPDLTGLIEVGSFAAAPKPRKGTARLYVDTDANILAFGATKREDGRMAIASDTKRLYHVATAGVVEIAYLPIVGGVMTGPVTTTQLTITTAISRIIPGATSLALRNNANNADNLLLTDAGVATVRSDLNLGARLLFQQAVGKIVPGATSLSLRNTADGADNLIVTDAGAVTIRAGLTVTAGGLIVTAGGLTVTAGLLTVAAGGADVTGAVTIRTTPLNFTAGADFVLGTTDAFNLILKRGGVNQLMFPGGGVARILGAQLQFFDGAGVTNFCAIQGTTASRMSLLDNVAAEFTRFDKGAFVDDMGLMLWDRTGNLLQRVIRGGVDSGGGGFRMLRILN